MIRIFDSHVHFNASQYSDEQRVHVLKKFENIENNSNIISKTAIGVGFDFNSSLMAVEHAKKYQKINKIFAAVGVHPDYAMEATDEQIEFLKTLISNNQENSIKGQKYIVAIGEIGLDYQNMKASKEVQRQWFRKQIRLALENKLPIIVHSRKADKETMDILKEEKAFSQGCGVLMHSYTGSAEFAKEYLKLGAHFGIGGAVTYENNRKTVEVVRTLPIEKILVETDAPFQTPVPFRGTMNETGNISLVIKKIAEIKGLSFDEVASITASNGYEFFALSYKCI